MSDRENFDDEINPSAGPNRDDGSYNPDDFDLSEWMEVLMHPDDFPPEISLNVPQWVADELKKFPKVSQEEQDSDDVNE